MDLRSRQDAPSRQLPLVVGLGNPDRSDDGVGPEVLRQLRGRGEGLARWEGGGDDPTRLLDLWAGAPLAIVVDAMISGAAPGTYVRFTNPKDVLAAGWKSTSTHGISLPVMIGLGQALDQMPRSLVVYGIEGTVFATGGPLSSHVKARVPEVVTRILEDLRAVADGVTESLAEVRSAHA